MRSDVILIYLIKGTDYDRSLFELPGTNPYLGEHWYIITHSRYNI